MSREHLPGRPSWDCLSCRESWPCAPAKERMLEEFAEDRLTLVMYLWVQMAEAIDDFVGLSDPVPDLYLRIVAWERAGTDGGSSVRSAGAGGPESVA